MHQQWRKCITTLAFVLFWGVAGSALAQAPKTPLMLKPDAPDRYTVVPGDTLWSIAQRYTDSPWRWNELWNLNKDEIKNPNRIYPGNVIVLDRGRGQLARRPDRRGGRDALGEQELPPRPGGDRGAHRAGLSVSARGTGRDANREPDGSRREGPRGGGHVEGECAQATQIGRAHV